MNAWRPFAKGIVSGRLIVGDMTRLVRSGQPTTDDSYRQGKALVNSKHAEEIIEGVLRFGTTESIWPPRFSMVGLLSRRAERPRLIMAHQNRRYKEDIVSLPFRIVYTPAH